jgi:prepilin-type N-terminal cleavage/methylation domain-containing protein
MKKAFTLIELLVVIAILGILSGTGIVAYNGYTAFAKENATKNNHKAIVNNMENEFAKCKLDKDSKIFGTHNCNSSSEPAVSTIVSYANNALGLKNPYDKNLPAVAADICTSGSLAIAVNNAGSYEVAYASSKESKKYNSLVSSGWSSNYSKTITTEVAHDCNLIASSSTSTPEANPWGERDYRIKVWSGATSETYKGIYFGVSGPQYVIMRTRDKSQMAADLPRLQYADGTQVAYVGRTDGFTMYCDPSKGACAKYEADPALIEYLMKGQCGDACM